MTKLGNGEEVFPGPGCDNKLLVTEVSHQRLRERNVLARCAALFKSPALPKVLLRQLFEHLLCDVKLRVMPKNNLIPKNRCCGGPARLDPSLEPKRSAVLISGLATGPPAGVGGGLGPFLAV